MKSRIMLFLLVGILIHIYPQKPNKQLVEQYSYGNSTIGNVITVQFDKGREHNHPLFAIWLTDLDGKFIQTLYVSSSVGRGVFPRAKRSVGSWQSGEIQRPATLPYWAHSRGILNESGNYMPTPRSPETDAHTGATPPSSFVMRMKTDSPLKGKYIVWLELNQTWDWNEFWTNDKFPGNKEYATSSQPALVYQAVIDADQLNTPIVMKAVGHSHYAGETGILYPDLSTLTTALKIAKKITVDVQ